MKARVWGRALPLFLLPLAILLVGCGDSGPTGPSYPDVVRTYSGGWTLRAVNQNTGQSAQGYCPGSITIQSQEGGSFSGSYVMEAGGDCDSPDSGNVSGSVRTDGGISASLSSPGGNPNEFEELTGCMVTSGDSQMSGTVSETRLDIEASFYADCPDGSGGYFPTRWTLGFGG